MSKIKNKTKKNTPNIENENTNHFFFYFCFLSLIPSILFSFVSSIMGVDVYTSFQKYCCFWLEKRGSTYTRINLYVRKYGIHYTSKLYLTKINFNGAVIIIYYYYYYNYYCYCFNYCSSYNLLIILYIHYQSTEH